jgi:NAD(P)-dependent dehydrogenase (short-subunit alcohol dehydrogenase family)
MENTMDLGLKDKVALVTGSGSQRGFGKGIVMTLAKEGCDIIAADIDLKGAEQTVADVKALGRKAIALEADVTKSGQVNDMVKTALEQFDKIDILVNTAGVGTAPKLFVEMTEEECAINININLWGTMNCTKAVLPHMMERKSGKVVNFSSTVGVTTMARGAVYGAAKAGIINFTGAIAEEVYESGINVNCIAPGLGATNFHVASGFPPPYMEMVKKMEAEGKTITPQDIANTVAFLVSDVSNKIVGQCIKVAGST